MTRPDIAKIRDRMLLAKARSNLQYLAEDESEQVFAWLHLMEIAIENYTLSLNPQEMGVLQSIADQIKTARVLRELNYGN